MNGKHRRTHAAGDSKWPIPSWEDRNDFCLLVWPFVFSAMCLCVTEENMLLDSQENHLGLSGCRMKPGVGLLACLAGDQSRPVGDGGKSTELGIRLRLWSVLCHQLAVWL